MLFRDLQMFTHSLFSDLHFRNSKDHFKTLYTLYRGKESKVFESHTK